MTSRGFDAEAAYATYFKCENLQRGGAFKIRGASNFILSLTPEQLAKGVVAFSSGNHAQAVALAAGLVGAKATLVMPTDAPRSKVEATRARGAEIITYDRLREDREAIGTRIAAQTGASLIPPYDHPWTIAGQGTTALELLEDAPEIDALITPVGGGGLLSGCSIAARSINPKSASSERSPTPPTTPACRSPPAAASRFRLRDHRRRPARHLPRPPHVPHPAAVCGSSSARQRGGDQGHGEVSAGLAQDPGRAQRRRGRRGRLHRKLPADVRRVGVVLSGGNVDLKRAGARFCRRAARRPACPLTTASSRFRGPACPSR